MYQKTTRGFPLVQPLGLFPVQRLPNYYQSRLHGMDSREQLAQIEGVRETTAGY
jgi:hypothetical protein